MTMPRNFALSARQQDPDLPPLPLTPLERQAKTHALCCSIGFLILLPFGVLIARYARTFTSRWFLAHSLIQLVISAPLIFVGWSKGYNTAEALRAPHFTDPHQKMGLALLIMYIIQLVGGAFIHWVKIPTRLPGRNATLARPIQNYVHVLWGLAILILAANQVHYGFDTEWKIAFGGLHPVTPAVRRAWIAVITVFWLLYILGLALLPRQFKQEREARSIRKGGDHIPLNRGQGTDGVGGTAGASPNFRGEW